MWVVYLIFFGGLALFLYLDFKAAALWDVFSGCRAYDMLMQVCGKKHFYAKLPNSRHGERMNKERIMQNP
ncbi:hypothetical protein [Tumebacillus flagellatus]|uniref:Uncharacterized protein n=1 Tax=Tumebacillus flagellatus TaxID=1157490 RepID=A0A074LYW9_9BACL|nr:hypothetical protein [Tumebacillus flagellatus]KEO85243.1 hypothetical protein EL26_01410 [Tumebacillus flagellatus]